MLLLREFFFGNYKNISLLFHFLTWDRVQPTASCDECIQVSSKESVSFQSHQHWIVCGAVFELLKCLIVFIFRLMHDEYLLCKFPQWCYNLGEIEIRLLKKITEPRKCFTSGTAVGFKMVLKIFVFSELNFLFPLPIDVSCKSVSSLTSSHYISKAWCLCSFNMEWPVLVCFQRKCSSLLQIRR